MMYPNGLKGKGNHKRGICSDGFPVHIGNVKLEDGSIREKEDSAPWPQPEGIFYKDDSSKQLTFSPTAFLAAVRYMYEKTVIERDAGSLALEYGAFATLLVDRVQSINGRLLFKTFPQLRIASGTPDSLVVNEDGDKHIPIDCLRDESDERLA